MDAEENDGSFYKKELQKTNQKEFRIEKVIKRKGNKSYVKWKGYNDSCNSWIDKKDMSQYFPPYRNSRESLRVKLDLSSSATKTDLNSMTHVDVSSFALKSNLDSLKTEVDKIDVDKLKTVPVDLSKLSNVVENVVKKTMYDKLVTKVNNIENTGFVLKNKYDTDKLDLEKKFVMKRVRYLVLVV